MDLITQIFLSHERWLTYFQHSGSKNLDHYYQNIIISQVDELSPLCGAQDIFRGKYTAIFLDNHRGKVLKKLTAREEF